MCDPENMDVMLGNYRRENYDVREEDNENEIDSRSNRQDHELIHNDEEFRSELNANLSENSGLTVETSRAINSKNLVSGVKKTRRTKIRPKRSGFGSN